MGKVKITLGDPVVIAQAAPDIKHWGPYQFPSIERLADGRLHCRYHIELDSAKAYGKDGGHAVSDDDGKTWKEEKPFKGIGGWLLPNGDRIKQHGMKAITLEPHQLPKEFICEAVCNSYKVPLYEPDDFTYEQSGMYFKRLRAGQTEWEICRTDLHIPYAKRIIMEGVLPYLAFDRFKVAPDGTLWGINYCYTYRNKIAGFAANFAISKDSGTTWRYMSSIYYKPDKHDRYWALRTGFTEPNIAFLPDGTIICLLRTDDSFHRGPSYCAYSFDGGLTWTDPERFDFCGVWPALLVLGNGVTLASYGRPGLYIRATADKGGKDWDDRVTVIPGTKCCEEPLSDNVANTCAYSDLFVLSDDTAYLVYSYFDYPNEKGEKCKTILGRTVKAEII